MAGVAGLSYGFDASGGIPGFLATLPGGLDGRWVLVPWLDSAPSVPESPTIAEAVAGFADEVEWTPAGLLLPGHGAARVVEGNALFHGFDEVVVFETKPDELNPLPMVFTSDCGELSQAERESVATYLDTNGAVAAAGDGVGLNWFLSQHVARE